MLALWLSLHVASAAPQTLDESLATLPAFSLPRVDEAPRPGCSPFSDTDGVEGWNCPVSFGSYTGRILYLVKNRTYFAWVIQTDHQGPALLQAARTAWGAPAVLRPGDLLWSGRDARVVVHVDQQGTPTTTMVGEWKVRQADAQPTQEGPLGESPRL